jgi:signal transduction histidine kinase
VQPQSLLERALVAHAPAAQQKQIELTLDAPPDLPEVAVDPDRMAQVLDNLVANALRYTPQNGRIQLSAQQNHTAVQLKIQDSGPGMDATELAHVFDRFYRGDKSRQRHDGGSGLGLAIVKSIVVAHNGRIWAESAPGQGATFIIELPLAIS